MKITNTECVINFIEKSVFFLVHLNIDIIVYNGNLYNMYKELFKDTCYAVLTVVRKCLDWSILLKWWF